MNESYKQRCEYTIGQLDDKFYLMDWNGSSFINEDGAWNFIGNGETVKCTSITFEENVNIDKGGRYFSSRSLSILIESDSSEIFRFADHIVDNKYKIIFADKMGNYFLFNNEFVFNVEFVINIPNRIELTLSVDSNHPMYNIEYWEKPSDMRVWFDYCGFMTDEVGRLFVNERDTLKINHRNSIITDIVTRFGEVSLNEIGYLHETLNLNIEYKDGFYNNELTFSIPLDNNKPYFRYGLLYFENNVYNCLINRPKYTIGLIDMLPSYTVNTSEDDNTPNTITFRFLSTTDSLIPFTDNWDITADEKIRWVPAERFRKNNVWIETEECVGYPSKYARRLLLRAQTVTGELLDQYMCHESMLEYYESVGLDIIGTYTDSDTIDGVDILFISDLCYRELPELCKFIEFLQNHTFTKTGETIFADVEGTCDWKITNIPDWLIFSQTSGFGGQRYTIRITCNVVDREWMTFDSYVTITTADTISKVRYQYSPENWMEGCSWLNTSFNNNVYAEETAVKVYITNPNVRANMIEIEGDTSEWDEAVNWFVNDDHILFKFSRYEGFEWHNIVITVNVAQHSESNCELVFHRNPKEEIAVPTDGTICQDGNLYGRKAVYYRYSPDGEAEFSHYEASNLIRENAVECSETIYVRWVEVPNEGVCELGAYYAIEYQEVSTDQITWTRSGEYRKGRVLDSDSRTCQTEPTYSEWRESDKTVCENGNLYGVDYHWLSDDGVHWYIDWGTSQRGRLLETNSAECGYVPPIQQIEEWRETVGYICEEKEEEYPQYSILYSTNDISVTKPFYINGSATSYYPKNNVTDELLTFDIDELTSLQYFCYYMGQCLTKIKFVGEWDTRSLTNMRYSLAYCKNITEIDIRNLDTRNVVNMEQTFSDLTNIKTLDLSYLDVSNVTNMGGLFAWCQHIERLNLSGWNTSKVTNMGSMFSMCLYLDELDLSGWSVSSVKEMDNMFGNCYPKTIKCPQAFKDWCITNKTAIALTNADTINWLITD